MNVEFFHIHQTVRHRINISLWSKTILDKNSRSKWRRAVVDVIRLYCKFLTNFIDKPINFFIYRYRAINENKKAIKE